MDGNVSSDPGQNGDTDPLFIDPVLYLYLTRNLSVVSGSGLSLKDKKGKKKIKKGDPALDMDPK